MSQFKSVKDLVIQTCATDGHFPSYERLTSLVRENFPASKWKDTHYAWYKSQIKTGKIAVPGHSPKMPDDEGGVDDPDIDEVVDASISLERDLHTYLSSRVHELEPGLKLNPGGVEYQTEAGRIDLLATDTSGNLVVIELKAGVAKDAAIGQLLGYMGCISKDFQSVRGILVASGFEPRTIFAARGLSQIRLLKYKVSFSLEHVQ